MASSDPLPSPPDPGPRRRQTRRLTLTSGSPLKLALLVALTAPLVLAHLMTPVSMEHQSLHDLHRHLLYLPVILAAFWYGWRGGLLMAVIVSLFYFPHILRHWMHYDLTTNVNQSLALAIYLVIGGVTGYLIDRLRGEQGNLRRANAQLAAQSEQLRAAMADLTERTREVFESEQQLRRADRLAALGQLTTGLAHELRNPLASIRGAAEILGDPQVPPAQREEFSRILIEETRRLDHVLGEFLDYARAQKAEASESCDLARTLEKVTALLGRQLKDAHVVLRVALPEALPALAIPENLLRQVLLNLLLNAIQAMPGGGELAIELVPPGDGHQPDRTLTVALRDSGPGIARENLERVFDPFFTTKTQGTGLGLSIVHKIINSYGGRIWVDPDWRAGARFLVQLPLG